MRKAKQIKRNCSWFRIAQELQEVMVICFHSMQVLPQIRCVAPLLVLPDHIGGIETEYSSLIVLFVPAKSYLPGQFSPTLDNYSIMQLKFYIYPDITLCSIIYTPADVKLTHLIYSFPCIFFVCVCMQGKLVK